MKIQGAAISLAGVSFAVVAVSTDLMGNTGEADMAIESLQPTFGGVPVVLMAQQPDGSPRYYGDADLVKMLAGVPVEEMPWKEYGA